jgi:transcriptional regulator with XRE-family HTH domain
MQESELYSCFGQRVRQHRERLNLNQAEVARAVGLSRASIANIETGRQRTPIHHLYRLARALRVDVHALLPAPNEEPRTIIDREIRSAVELSSREKEEVAKVVGGVVTAAASRGAE